MNRAGVSVSWPLALFGWGWLFVFVTSINEAEIIRLLASDEGGRRIEMMKIMGVGEVPSSASIMMTSWSHPIVFLLDFDLGDRPGLGRDRRGSGARHDGLNPVPPGSALGLSRVSGIRRDAGLAILPLALLAGASIAVHYNVLREPPTPWTLIPPAVNLAALGLPIYGYTLLASSIDSVRWRPRRSGRY